MIDLNSPLPFLTDHSKAAVTIGEVFTTYFFDGTAEKFLADYCYYLQVVADKMQEAIKFEDFFLICNVNQTYRKNDKTSLLEAIKDFSDMTDDFSKYIGSVVHGKDVYREPTSVQDIENYHKQLDENHLKYQNVSSDNEAKKVYDVIGGDQQYQTENPVQDATSEKKKSTNTSKKSKTRRSKKDKSKDNDTADNQEQYVLITQLVFKIDNDYILNTNFRDFLN